MGHYLSMRQIISLLNLDEDQVKEPNDLTAMYLINHLSPILHFSG